jgi:hypothetical protein
MVSTVELCNMALLHVGSENFIESLEAEAVATARSKEAQVCNAFIEIARTSFLRKFNWNFANNEKVLAPFGTSTADFAYQYAYPNDCLKAIAIKPSIPNFTIPFAVAMRGGSKVIRTDVKDASLEYTKSVPITDFDPLAALALSYSLARLICMPLSASASKLEEIKKAEAAAMYEAQAFDGNEGLTETPTTTEYSRARG